MDDYSFDEGSSLGSSRGAAREVFRARAELAIARAGNNKMIKNESERHLHLVQRKEEIEKLLTNLGVNVASIETLDDSMDNNLGNSARCKHHMHLRDVIDSDDEYQIKPPKSMKIEDCEAPHAHPSQGAQGHQNDNLSKFMERKRFEGQEAGDTTLPAKSRLTSQHKVSVVAPISGEYSNRDNEITVKDEQAEQVRLHNEVSLSSGLEVVQQKCSDCENGLDSSFEGEFKMIELEAERNTESAMARHRAMIRRKSTLFDNRTAIGKYIDVFWKKEIEMKHIESGYDID